MKYPRKVILQLPLSGDASLDKFVEDCLISGVGLVAIWGENASIIEDEIDWLVISGGSDNTRFFVTTAHEPNDNPIEFARIFIDGSEPAVITL
jgi:hypothetical protein